MLERERVQRRNSGEKDVFDGMSSCWYFICGDEKILFFNMWTRNLVAGKISIFFTISFFFLCVCVCVGAKKKKKTGSNCGSTCRSWAWLELCHFDATHYCNDTRALPSKLKKLYAYILFIRMWDKHQFFFFLKFIFVLLQQKNTNKTLQFHFFFFRIVLVLLQ